MNSNFCFVSCPGYSCSFLLAVLPAYSPAMSLTCLSVPPCTNTLQKIYPVSIVFNFFLIKAQSKNITFNRQSNILQSFYLYTGSQCSTKIALLNESKTEFSWLTLEQGSCNEGKKDYVF